MGYPALAVANYFIQKANEENEQVDPLKLQKLIYFANGWHLALRGTPLIQEKIHAWKYGPVVESVYQAFKRYGSRPIDEVAGSTLIPGDDAEAIELLDTVWELYGHYSGVQLSNLSHDPEGPWSARTRSALASGWGPKMRDDEMRKYFMRLVEEARAGT